MNKHLQPAATLLAILCSLSAAPLEAQKTKVAISPFLDRSGLQSSTTSTAEDSGVASSTGAKGDLGGQVADAITTELVKLGRYDIIERVELEKVISEQKLQLADLDDVSRASEAARLLGADLLVTGSITEAASAQTGKGYIVMKKKELLGRVVLDSRLIDVRSTKALWGTTNEGVETLTSKKIMGVGKDDLAGIQLLLGKAARQAADEFVTQLVPVLDQYTGRRTGDSVLETAATLRSGSVYLPVGSKVGVAVGEKFDLFVLGDPFTVGGKTIREPLQVGTFEVTDVQPEYSRGPAPDSLSSLSQMSLEALSARRPQPPDAVPQSPEPAPSSAASEFEYRSISVDQARVRSGPGTEFAVSSVLARGSRVAVLGATADWIKVRTDAGEEGWIHVSLISEGS